MANIPIRDIPGAVVASPDPSNLIPMDNGSLMQKTTIANAVNTTLPLSSQAEAEAGVDNAKRMSSLRTKQAIDAQTPAIVNTAITALNLGSASQAQVEDFATAIQGAKADSAVQPSRAVGVGAGLTGGGDLSADRTISLSSGTIASLSRADSSVQTVNGTPPDGSGNVIIDAEFLQEQNSVTTAMAESFAPTVEWVRTAGYSSAGDGGGALYKRVLAEPSHAGKFQSTDGAWWGLVLRDQVNSSQFGGDIPSAVTTMRTVGGKLRIPAGEHTVNSPIVIDYSDTTGDTHVDPRGVYVEGDGQANTLLNNEVDSEQYAIQVLGDNSAAGGFGAIVYAGVEGLTVAGGVRGLKAKEVAFCNFKDLMFRSVSVGMDLESVLSTTFERIMFTGGINGVQVSKGAGFSDHNANKWHDCEFRLGSGVAFSGGPSSGLWFDNLTVQGWGTHGVVNTGGMDLNFTGAEGAVGLVLNAGYLEANKGGFDIRLTNNGVRLVTHVITGVNFTRLGNTEYVTNNIKLIGPGPQRLVLIGCDFRGLEGYVPNAARPYVSFNPSETEVVCYGCTFESALERGDLRNESDKSFAGSVASAGTAIKLPANWSSVKSTAGVYVVTHNLPLTSADYSVVATVNSGDSLVVQRVIQSTNSFTVVTTSPAGVLSDAAFVFQLRVI